MKTIGEKIKLFRNECKITQFKLGELAGIAYPTIQKYEQDKINPSKKSLTKIALALGIPVQSFLTVEKLKDTESSFINTLKPNEKLKLFRHCAGWEEIVLANTIISFQGKESTATLGDLKDLTDILNLCEKGTVEISEELSKILSEIFDMPTNFFSEENTRRVDLSEKRIQELTELILSNSDSKKYEVFLTNYVDSLKKEKITLLEELIITLNTTGITKLLDYAKDLSQLEKYTQSDPVSEYINAIIMDNHFINNAKSTSERKNNNNKTSENG